MSGRDGDARYYRHASRLPFISRVSAKARRNAYRTFLAACRPGPTTTILDVGVSTFVEGPETNTLEREYPYRGRVTCAGIEDGAPVLAAYPGVAYVRLEPHRPLPFGDGAFDVAYCNAVIEHVGSRDRQAALVAELSRVAAEAFMVVPNRWFPIEPHTGLPFVHWLPNRAFRALLRPTPLRFWAEEEHLNPLTARSLAALAPADRSARIVYCGLGPRGFASNLALHLTRR